MRRLLLISLTLACSQLAQANLAGSSTLPELPVFAQAQVVDSREQADQQRIYPLAALRRISGRLEADHVVSAGQLKTLTYQLPATLPPLQAIDQAREHLQQQGYHVLYWCEGRECGSSNLWANQVFANAKLYGPEDQQSYMLLRQADQLLALYGITRGNRRSYLHAEHLAASSPLTQVLPSAGTLLRQLRRDGQLHWVQAQAPQPDWLERVVAVFSLDSTLRLSVQGEHSQAWFDALKAYGVSERRVELNPSDASGVLLRPY